MMDIIKAAQKNNFLIKEFKISKDLLTLTKIILGSDSSRLKYNAFSQNEDALPSKLPFITLVPDPSSEKDTSQAIPKEFTLAQCILYLIEKAINVHYKEYLKNLTAE